MGTRVGVATLLVLVACVLVACVLVACSAPNENVGVLASQAALPLADQAPNTWQSYRGAEGTVCANGSAYEHFAYKGEVNKLVIDFQGGGACWEDGSCKLGSSQGDFFLYFDEVNSDELIDAKGLYNRARQDNPVADWYHVFIPYCTGDIHIGNATRDYVTPIKKEAYTVRHNGAVNASSVLDWTFANFQNPEQIFITGCSAGAYGAAYWTETVAKNYPGADIKQLGDCGVGVAKETFAATAEANWNTSATFPELTFDENAVSRTYLDTTRAFENVQMAQYTSVLDSIQVLFFIVGGLQNFATRLEWFLDMRGALRFIDFFRDNFSYYVSALDENTKVRDGTAHCVINRDELYSLTTNGTKFVDWLGTYLDGGQPDSIFSGSRF